MASDPQQRHRALQVLGLTESATNAEIADTWRELVRATHPDLTGDTSPATADRLRDILWAHRVLAGDGATGATPRPSRPIAVRPRRRRQRPIVAGPTRFVPSRDRAQDQRGGGST